MSEALMQQEFGPPDFLKAYPERPELTACVTEERPLHTAKIAGKDKALCRAVCVDLLAGRPKTAICADYGVGWETVTAIEGVMRQRGELRGYGQVLVEGLSSCIALMIFRLKEALVNNEFSAAQIPIAVGILIDKRGQLEAGMVPGTGRTVEENTLARVQAAWALAQAASDAQSARSAANGPIIEAETVRDTTQDTSPSGSPADGARGVDGGDLAAAQPGPEPAQQEGGGIGPRATSQGVDGLGRQNLDPKDDDDACQHDS